MNKVCKNCGQNFEITDGDLEFYKRFDVPMQDLCFRCSQMQKLAFRNERKLYLRKCDFSGENIISIYSKEKPYKIYKSEYFYSDKWDPLEFGQDFDFSKSFFKQFKKLKLKVPRIALINAKGENSEYCNMTYGNKNCYLVFGGDFNQDTLYGTLCMNNRDCIDLDYSNSNELSYYLNDCVKCYECYFAFDSKNCTNCAYISDCIGCNECLFCTNLIKKSYYIFNKQYSKEEYFKEKENILSGSYSKSVENFVKFLDFIKNRIVKNYHGISCENSTGDYLKNCKNCENCYDASDSEDLKNIIFAIDTKDCFNSCLLGGNRSELCYNCVSTIGVYNAKFSYLTIDSNNIEYCDQTFNSEDLFGCIGLRHKKYCILNKQYSKDEYFKLKERIIKYMKEIGEWGRFFPPDMAIFGYNESTAHKYFPLTEKNALEKGFSWKQDDNRDFKPQTCVMEDNISASQENIVNEVLVCKDCGKNYKIVLSEYKFHKKAKIPLPRNCSECRHLERTRLRNPKMLWERNCSKCGKAIKTTYSPNRTEKVYCEECYLKEVV